MYRLTIATMLVLAIAVGGILSRRDRSSTSFIRLTGKV